MNELSFVAGFITYPIMAWSIRRAVKRVLMYWAVKWGALNA